MEIQVADEGQIEEGKGIVADANGKPIAIFKKDGQYFAFDNTCQHRGGPLGEGELEDYVVTCPMHGWQYDIKTGECLTMPNHKQEIYKVRVENGKVLIEL